ncbi:MAG TPA: Fur family transcriptional regulator [Pyrinomonadaceae bacterium]|nr:Fur family transcriptional regulator [Pyrinomonadaceae bacterium]
MRTSKGTRQAQAREAVLREKLQARGGHLTQQRAAVFRFIQQAPHHPTAEEVYLAVKQELPRLSLATVYKNLEALVTAGAISKLTYGDAAARYDMRTDHHYHTRCLGCGKIWDIDPGQGSELLKQIKPQAGFAVQDYRLELVGHCRECRQ